MIPATQREGWNHIKAVLSAVQWRVWHHLAENPGKTRNEIDVALGDGKPNCTASRRLAELERMGALRRGKARKCGVTGRNSATWWPEFGTPVKRTALPPSRRAQLEAAIKRIDDEVKKAPKQLFVFPAIVKEIIDEVSR